MDQTLLTLGAVAVLVMASACATVEMELVSLGGARIEAAVPAEPEPEPVAVEAPKAVQVTATKLNIEEKIQFKTWSAELLVESHAILDEIADTLKQNPQIQKLEIQGHTARAGQSKRSLELSMKRAVSVRDYLVKQGVKKDRLVARGFGDQQPVADNSTPEGREKNRRVELVIVKSAAGVEVAQAPAAATEEEDDE